jgi:DNA-binding MarR family transcriptional regulator
MGPLPAASDRFLDRFLPHLLARAAQAAAEAFHTELRERGTSVPVWRVLATLADGPGETVTALAATCLLQQPTMTKLLDRMEQDGLVRRVSDERDGRAVRVSLTAAGKVRAADLLALAQRHEANLLSRDPEAEAIKPVLRGIVARPGHGETGP